MKPYLPLIVCALLFALLAACCDAQGDRPRKKMIEALTAIDVSAGSEEIQYRASLPWMIAQSLVYAGVKTNYAEFCAVSGWSAEFHYAFDRVDLAYLTFSGLPSGRCFSRGLANYGKRFEVFSWPKAEDENERLLGARAAWEFAVMNLGEGTPVLTDYLDGGVLYGYDETLEDPALYFSTNGPGFGAIKWSKFVDSFQKDLWGFAIIEDATEPATDPRTLLVGTLANLLLKSAETESDGATAGVAAMRALGDDLLSPARDWGGNMEWLCWPLSEQSETRLCTAVYLRRNADLLNPEAAAHALAAADYYEEAFRCWRSRWEATWLTGGQRDPRDRSLLFSDTGRREAIAGHVFKALGAELLALGEVQKALLNVQAEKPE